MTEPIQLPADSSFMAHQIGIFEYWKKNGLTNLLKSSHNITQNEDFDLMDGPPFVSGDLHLGHLCISAFKDLFRRYHRMIGYLCDNMCGFDCHGLPIESLIMKNLNLFSSDKIETFGVDRFSIECKKKIDEFITTWEEKFNAVGRDIDMNNKYMTKDVNFMETVWWIFSEMYKKGLIYEGCQVLPYSWACETPLSNFEVSDDTYKMIDTKSPYVCFQMKNDQTINFVAWTTTPWTLLSNLALCVNPEFKYVICTHANGKKYVVSEESVKNLRINFASIEFYAMGKDMVGIEYNPLFDFLKHKYHKIVANDYVSKSDTTGTGIVHLSPYFGEDDNKICVQNNVITQKEMLNTCLVSSSGCFTKDVGKYAGMNVFDTCDQIIDDLKQSIIRVQIYNHKYPFCYRSGKPLIYMICKAFFVKVTAIKDRMIKLMETTQWANDSIKKNKFGKWLENARDWNITRNRYWGTPIPVFTSDDGTEMCVISSIDELIKVAGLKERPTDIHREFFDRITFIQNGKLMKSTGTIFDCWFESGSVPFAKLHYPFENTNYFDNKEFLSDFIVEGADQTRGWFYTLLIISTSILNKAPYKKVICTGLALDKFGKKISKKSGNYEDPKKAYTDVYGTDYVRFYILRSKLSNGGSLRFIKNEDEKKEIKSKKSDTKSDTKSDAKSDTKSDAKSDTNDDEDVVDDDSDTLTNVIKDIIRYVNATKLFIEQYTNIKKNNESFTVNYLTDDSDVSKYSILDQWILEKVSILQRTLDKYMNDLNPSACCKALIKFIDDLSNWYIKMNRDRMKGMYGDEQQFQSMSVTYTVLKDFTLLMAPFMPVLSEHIYQHLVFPTKELSVHLEKQPVYVRNYNTSEMFEKFRSVIDGIRYIRTQTKKHQGVKVPILSCTVYTTSEKYFDTDNDTDRNKEFIDIIQDETGCLELKFDTINDNMITYKLKGNPRNIKQNHKEFKNIQGLMTYLNNVSAQTAKDLYGKDNYEISEYGLTLINGTDYTIEKNIVVDNTHSTYNINNLMFSVDLTYDQTTHELSQVKKFSANIQKFRKVMKLKPWNKIYYRYDDAPNNIKMILQHHEQLLDKRLGKNIDGQFDKSETMEYQFEPFDNVTYDKFNLTIQY